MRKSDSANALLPALPPAFLEPSTAVLLRELALVLVAGVGHQRLQQSLRGLTLRAEHQDSVESARDAGLREPRQFEQKGGVTTARAAPASTDAAALEREAAACLAEALGQQAVPGARERHRGLLARAIACAERAIEAGAGAKALTVLAQAHAARARDAAHGANQLSMGSQRAPTRAACDDGWERVAAIAAVAEESAREVRRLATVLCSGAARKALRQAEAAARDARRIVAERNHAYTFHADPAFSFGEGWHLAAAALLGGAAIQIEPGKRQTAQVERFLRDAGLSHVPYRPRPRSNKQLTGIVAEGFRADPHGAQQRLRAAFLGGDPIPRPIADWIDRKLTGAPAGSKVLLWLRYGAHHAHRNTGYGELVEIARRATAEGIVPVLIGDALREGPPPPGSFDLTLFFREPPFQGEETRRAQLQLFEHLKAAHGLVGQIGVTTAGMDGPALLGLPTLYLTQEGNVRMRQWVGAVPGYEEVVRTAGYLERISATLRRWKSAAHAAGKGS